MVWAPEPLKVTKPEAGVNDPLLDQFPPTKMAWLLPASKVVFDPIVKSFAIVKASPKVTVPVPFVVTL